MDSRAFQVNRLTDDQRQHPLEHIREVFTKINLQDIRQTFDHFVFLAMTQEGEETGLTKGDILFIRDNIEMLAEAAYLLASKEN